MRVAGLGIRDPSPVGGGHICTAYRGVLDDGSAVFAKTHPDPPDGFFLAEAAGLDLLRVADGPPVPDVLAVAHDGLVLSWVEPGRPSPRAARAFGHALARMHAAQMPSFGASHDGFIGSVPLPNTSHEEWPTFYAENRIKPYLSALSPAQRGPVEAVCDHISRLAGPAEPPARIHGDLWSGNLLWGADEQVWLVDAAAAHGGHRETDLALLQWFGAPHLDAMVAAYEEQSALAAGWRERVPLHQLHPMLVHATLFGGSYGESAAAAARSLLATG